jgi:hypothetical protein
MKLAELDRLDRHNATAEPENPVVEVETGAFARRYTHKDGAVEWKATGRELSRYEQDALEEAYEMGRKAAEGKAWGKGAYEAAMTAYSGRRQ